jgi:hypothetical protein
MLDGGVPEVNCAHFSCYVHARIIVHFPLNVIIVVSGDTTSLGGAMAELATGRTDREPQYRAEALLLRQ